jgi:hypothetical protein
MLVTVFPRGNEKGMQCAFGLVLSLAGTVIGWRRLR